MRTNRNRRRFLKGAATVGFAGAFAGCTGGDGGGGGGGVDTPPETEPPQTTSTDTTEEGEHAEWRKQASREAEKELSDSSLQHIMSVDPWKARIEVQDFGKTNDVFSPLTNSVTPLLGSGETNATRYKQVISAGRAEIDLITGQLARIAQEVEFGDMSNIPGYQQQPDATKTTGPTFASLGMPAVGLGWNTDMVSDPPTAYEDLLDSQWAGKKIALDFTPNATWATYMVEDPDDKYGEEYLTALGEQEPKWYKRGPNTTANVGQGTVPVGIFGKIGWRFRYPDLPIAVTNDPAGLVWVIYTMGLSAKPQHPWGAQLYADYLASPIDQNFMLVEKGRVSPYGEIAWPQDWSSKLDLEQVVTFNDLTMSTSEGTKQFQQLVGAPV